jgi:hypothetical protein
MTTDPLTGTRDEGRGLRHEAVLYGSDEELLDSVVPFLRDGLAAGEPTLVAWSGERAALLRAAMPEAGGVVFLDGPGSHLRPTSTIKAYREMFASYVAAGASRIRVVGELAGSALGSTWWWWSRYESALNRIYDEFPLWCLCTYDTRTTAEHVLDDVTRTHPRIMAAGTQQRANERYVPVEEFVSGQAVGTDPLEAGPPLIDLIDPEPVDARHLVFDADEAGRLPASVDVDSVVMVLNEAVTNAVQHGVRPVGVRLWAGDERVVVAVTDRGAGPSDPLAGLVPAPHYPKGGVGLWLAHELSDHVTFERGDRGYTFRAAFGHLEAV